MHPLHDYVAKQLADKLKQRKVVGWYDPQMEKAGTIWDPHIKQLAIARTHRFRRITPSIPAIAASKIPDVSRESRSATPQAPHPLFVVAAGLVEFADCGDCGVAAGATAFLSTAPGCGTKPSVFGAPFK